MSSSCSQVVPSAYPDLHDLERTSTTDRQLNELLEGLVSELFPPGTDPFDVYAYGTRLGSDIYATTPPMEQAHQLQQHEFANYGQPATSIAVSATPIAPKGTQPYFSSHQMRQRRYDADWGQMEATRFNYSTQQQQQFFPKDPRRWSIEHVQAWIQSAAFEQRLGSIDPMAFSMNGDQLSRLSRDEFKLRAPLAGDILFSLYASLVKGADPQQRRIGGSKCVHPTWYPKVVALPSSPPTNSGVASSAAGATTKESSDTFSDCSSSASCCFEEKGSQSYSGTSRYDANSPPSSSSFYNPPQTINYTPITGVNPSLSLCDSIHPSASTASYSLMNINPFPQRKYRPPVPKDALPTHLRTFLKELLSNKMYSYCIEWADESKGIFRILNSEEVARFWGIRKNRPKMNYDKLSRSLRFYYKKRLLKKVPGQRLVYQFTEPDEYDEKDAKKSQISPSEHSTSGSN